MMLVEVQLKAFGVHAPCFRASSLVGDIRFEYPFCAILHGLRSYNRRLIFTSAEYATFFSSFPR